MYPAREQYDNRQKQVLLDGSAAPRVDFSNG